MQNIKSKFFQYLPEFVYGSIDGTVTTFAIIAGIAGANLNPSIVLILGFSNVLADGFSMASSNYLSEQSHKDQLKSDGEDHHGEPIKTAIATFFSFLIIGSIPLVSYVVSYFKPTLFQNEFAVASILTIITFFIIGLIRGSVSHESSFKTAFQTCIIGIIAASVAYGVGFFLKDLA
jgi:VIT1/CCC1 family predicted Fe2+/Mn2+ transporter